MKFQRLKQAPVLIAASVLLLVCLARVFELDFFERLERITYDMRVRTALRFPSNVATNLGFVFINEESVDAVKSGDLGYHFGLYWPRQVYGRLVKELAAQGAECVALDVIFGGLRDDHPSVHMENGEFIESDEYFAHELRRASNVIIAITPDLQPPDLFATNALAVGDITTDKDSDGVLRRAFLFRTYRRWHPLFKQAEADPGYGIDLRRATNEPGKIILPRSNGEVIEVPVDAQNNFELAAFVGDKLPPGTAPKAKAFTDERVWHMGVRLAAQELKLDLANASVDLEQGRVVLRGAGGLERIVPVDRDGGFYIDWSLPSDDQRLAAEPIHRLLWQHRQRLEGKTNNLSETWRGKLVVVGSSAQVGNDLTDRGATPLAEHALLVSKHWNVANSILTGRFVRRASLEQELCLILVLGAMTAYLTWRWRVFSASAGILFLSAIYCAYGVFLYAQYRFWLPLVLPILGAVLAQHVVLVTYRVVFEERDKRRVKSIFSKVVAPEVMNELLRVEKLSLGGARREVTVLFADVRGFTELTDYTQERAAEYVRDHKLSHEAAEACIEEFARETLNTVNAYLTCVIDAATRERGTFDKLIGDCVMFFWNAPLDLPQHALASVRAAISAQRAIYKLNQHRAVENQQREIENRARESAGLPPKPPLATLTLGTGINTGVVTAGITGSIGNSINYTVFGREVNLASRLEGISGRGRIIISEATYQHLLRDDATLAATCIEREPVTPKGFNRPVRIYEVPWLPPGEVAEDFQTMMFVKPKAPVAQS